MQYQAVSSEEENNEESYNLKSIPQQKIKPTLPEIITSIASNTINTTFLHSPKKNLKKFIRLKKKANYQEDNNSSSPKKSTNIKKNNPEVEEVVDLLDANNEDPFTLETLESLISLHWEKEKDFLLSRVTTVDPNNEEKFYRSYYAAHHINKVLFRTQPSEGLLHRMRAKNPLNNMTIVGDVEYYVIKSPKKNLSNLKQEDKKSNFFSIKENFIENVLTSPKFNASNKIKQFFDFQEKKNERNFEKLNSASSSPTSPTSSTKLLEKRDTEVLNIPSSPNLSSPSFSPTSSLKSPLFNLFFGQNNQTTNSLNQSIKKKKKKTLHLVMKPEAFEFGDLMVDSEIDKNRRKSFEINRNLETVILVSPTRSENGFFLKDEDEKNINKQNNSEFHLSRRKLKKFFDRNDDDLNKTEKTNPNCSNSFFFSPTSNNLFYNAVYYGTDDDFLMKSSVRAFFKENALENDDSVLFTLPTNDSNVNLNPHPTLPNFMFAVEDEEGETRDWNVISGNKTLKIMLLSYVGFGIVFVKYIVPDAYAYIVAFMMIFSVCLGLLLFF